MSKLAHTTSFQHHLDALPREFAALDEGEVASYTPELARANPAHFGIALLTVDGHFYPSGETRQAFSIQSISKAFTYGMALEDNGVQAVLQRIGVEPSGQLSVVPSLPEGCVQRLANQEGRSLSR